MVQLSWGLANDCVAPACTQQLSSGQRVKYVGITGQADGPTGRVSRVCKAYVKVRWDDGRCEDVHPEDVRAI